MGVGRSAQQRGRRLGIRERTGDECVYVVLGFRDRVGGAKWVSVVAYATTPPERVATYGWRPGATPH
jgi:hypothetical protein